MGSLDCPDKTTSPSLLKEVMGLSEEDYQKQLKEEKGKNLQTAVDWIVQYSREQWLTCDIDVVDDLTCVVLDLTNPD